MRVAIGVDLGGTSVRAVVGDAAGQILAEESVPTRAEAGAAAGVATIAGLIEAVAAQAGINARAAVAIGVGSPGPMDMATGTLLNPPNLQWGNLPLRDRLAERFGVPTLLTNDCKAAGYGEYRFGAGRGTRDMVYLGVGTGIGGCVIIGGQIYYGATGNAGEIGHTVVALDGPRCGCGARGCLEALASGSALTRMGREAADRGEGARLLALAGGQRENISGGHVAQAAAAGDAPAQAILALATRALGAGVANVMNAFGPARVVLGGGVVAKNGQPYVDAVAAAARDGALAGAWAPVVAAELGERSGVLGALALAWDSLA